MKVLRVSAEGTVTSFRYPHFMIGVQPTFDVPPPATIYGHICSALGAWFDPIGVQFAVHFSYAARFEDIEHAHILGPSSGKLPGSKIPKVLEGAVNPLRRELLFKPRLDLYINRPDWIDAFKSPRYPVVLGRSQDLFTYSRVEIVELAESEEFYLEHTYGPFDLTRKTPRGYVVLMPRFVNPHEQRSPTFERYVVIHDRVHAGDMLCFEDEPVKCWVDPDAPVIRGDQRGLIFHSWMDEDAATNKMA